MSSQYLEDTQLLQPVTTGGKKLIRKCNKNKTGTRGRGKFLKNWSKQKPGYHQRTIMMKNCGKKCFLGPRKSFPICTKNTCKRNRKGVYAAYIRAEEYDTIAKRRNPKSQKYKRISAKARKLLNYTSKIDCK
jgi:hypothetical protein